MSNRKNIINTISLCLFLFIFLVVPLSSQNKKFLLNQNDILKCNTEPQIHRKYEKKIDVDYQKAMSAYASRHYGINDWQLKEPKILVVHATFVATFRSSLAYFTGNYLRLRPDLTRGGKVNIGIHFLVDRKGKIYSLMPLNAMTRHAVGINHTAIGIENVAHRNPHLTKAQLISNLQLIAYLKKKFPSLQFVIGHDEYNNKKLPHYKYVLTKDKKYQQWDKPDPGKLFMRHLRGNYAKCGITPNANQ